MSIDKRISRGRRIKEVFEDEDVKALFEDIEQDTIKAWRRAETPEKREEAWAELRALDALRTKVNAVVGDGQMAEHEQRNANRGRPVAS